MTRAPYRRADLLMLTGYKTEDSFRAFRARAEPMGFPKPLPGCTRPLKWSPEQVDAWFAEGGRPAARAPDAVVETPAAPEIIDELTAARLRLKAKLERARSA